MSLKENLVKFRNARGLSQHALAKMINVGQNTIASIETGATKKTKYLSDLARALGVTVDELDPPEDQPPASGFVPVSTQVGAQRDFPVYASAEGGPGEIVRSAEPVDWIPRPEPVARVKSAYGIYIVGESMAPEFEPGDIAVINPILPLVRNATCILYTELHGEARATVKRVLRSTDEKWFLRQWNPQKDFSLSRREWNICHRVVNRQYRQ